MEVWRCGGVEVWRCSSERGHTLFWGRKFPVAKGDQPQNRSPSVVNYETTSCQRARLHCNQQEALKDDPTLEVMKSQSVRQPLRHLPSVQQSNPAFAWTPVHHKPFLNQSPLSPLPPSPPPTMLNGRVIPYTAYTFHPLTL